MMLGRISCVDDMRLRFEEKDHTGRSEEQKVLDTANANRYRLEAIETA
jgi:hypothetical protein